MLDHNRRVRRGGGHQRRQGIDGVATAELTGGSTPILDIVLDPEAMAEHGIALQQVQGILYANQITLPAGSMVEGDLRLPVSTLHGYTSIAELEAQIVGSSGGAAAAGGARSMNDINVWADTQTNALVIDAPPKMMRFCGVWLT